MIAVDLTKEAMLAEIQAGVAGSARLLRDPSDRRFVAAPEAHLVVQGSQPDDLLPVLNVRLSQRFAGVPLGHLMSGLLQPLKKGVGNAYKWGNCRDSSKHITVEVFATSLGAVVAVTDQGAGFDVERRLGKFREGQPEYRHGGSGLSHLSRTVSLVSYAEGGRTLLIRFLCVPELGRSVSPPDRARWGAAADADAAVSLLAASVPEFRCGAAALEACRIHVHEGRSSTAPHVTFHLRCREASSGRSFHEVLAGLLFSGPGPAAAARLVTGQLFGSPALGPVDIRVPEPVGSFDDPPVVVFRFNPQLHLEDYLKQRADPRLLERPSLGVASLLRILHGSGIAVGVEETLPEAMERYRAAGTLVQETLAREDRRRRRRAEEFLGRLDAGAGRVAPCAACTIHGDFGWRHVVRSEETFYMTGFGDGRRSHPGFDVGGFLADLRRFAVLGRRVDRSFHQEARDAFLSAYSGADPPAWLAEAPFFEGCGLLLRMRRLLGRPREKWDEKIDVLLDESNAALS